MNRPLVSLAISILALAGAGGLLGVEAAKHVVQLEAPASADGIPVEIQFSSAGGPTYRAIVVVRAGKHVYDLRHLPGWRGEIDGRRVRVLAHWAAGGFAPSLKRPVLADHLDTLVGTQRLNPMLVNDLNRRSAFARSLEEIVLLAWAVLTLSLLVASRRPGRSALGAAAIVLVLAQLVSVADHAAIVRLFESRQLEMPVFGRLESFARDAEILIEGSSWGSNGISGVTRSMVHYRLAEARFVPAAASFVPTFMVRGQLGGGEVVLALPGVVYLERTAP